MAFNTEVRFYGGESRDTVSECLTEYQVASSCTVDSATGIVTGTRSMKFPYNTNAAIALLPFMGNGISGWNAEGTVKTVLGDTAPGVGAIVVAQGFMYRGAISSTAYLISHNAQDSRHYLGVTTGGNLVLTDKDGLIRYTSQTAIAASTATHFAVCFDSLTLPGGFGAQPDSYGRHLWATIWVNKLLDGAVYLGYLADFFTDTDTLKWGEYLAGGTNRGADIYFDDLGTRQSITTADAPHLTAYPILRGEGGAGMCLPAADGTYNEFGGTPTVTYADVTTNDGDTSYRNEGTVSNRQTFRWTQTSGTNPLTGSVTVDYVIMRANARLEGGGKFGAYAKTRIASTDGLFNLNQILSTSYAGVAWPLVEPVSGSTTGWARSDFDGDTDNLSKLQFGFETPAAGTVGPRVTYCPGPEAIWHNETLPLGPTPFIPISGAALIGSAPLIL